MLEFFDLASLLFSKIPENVMSHVDLEKGSEELLYQKVLNKKKDPLNFVVSFQGTDFKFFSVCKGRNFETTKKEGRKKEGKLFYGNVDANNDYIKFIYETETGPLIENLKLKKYLKTQLPKNVCGDSTQVEFLSLAEAQSLLPLSSESPRGQALIKKLRLLQDSILVLRNKADDVNTKDVDTKDVDKLNSEFDLAKSELEKVLAKSPIEESDFDKAEVQINNLEGLLAGVTEISPYAREFSSRCDKIFADAAKCLREQKYSPYILRALSGKNNFVYDAKAGEDNSSRVLEASDQVKSTIRMLISTASSYAYEKGPTKQVSTGPESSKKDPFEAAVDCLNKLEKMIDIITAGDPTESVRRAEKKLESILESLPSDDLKRLAFTKRFKLVRSKIEEDNKDIDQLRKQLSEAKEPKEKQRVENLIKEKEESLNEKINELNEFIEQKKQEIFEQQKPAILKEIDDVLETLTNFLRQSEIIPALKDAKQLQDKYGTIKDEEVAGLLNKVKDAFDVVKKDLFDYIDMEGTDVLNGLSHEDGDHELKLEAVKRLRDDCLALAINAVTAKVRPLERLIESTEERLAKEKFIKEEQPGIVSKISAVRERLHDELLNRGKLDAEAIVGILSDGEELMEKYSSLERGTDAFKELDQLIRELNSLMRSPKGAFKQFETDIKSEFNRRRLKLQYNGAPVINSSKLIEYIKPAVLFRLYLDFGGSSKGVTAITDILVEVCEGDVNKFIELNEALKRAKADSAL